MSAVLIARQEARQRAEAKRVEAPTPASELPVPYGICLDCGGPAEVSICRKCLCERGA